jgi:hypothetical protein
MANTGVSLHFENVVPPVFFLHAEEESELA